MLEKMTFIAFLLSAVFGYSDGTFHIDASASEGYELGQEVRLIHERPQKRSVPLQFSAHKKPIQASRNEEFEELEEELEALIEEMKKMEKEAREKVLKEILPRIKEEIEKLREKLRKWQDEEDESEPIKVEALEI
jgi:predicted RNase H-like nuclease (RuvC/YqgF family)